MSKTAVSNDFSNFMAKNAQAVQEAKEAENSMKTCSMPVGWEGSLVCIGAVADKGKDRKDEKGITQEGRPYVRLDFQVINDEKYSGAEVSKAWSFFDTEKASAMQRFEWMLNDMENLGLPVEIRKDSGADVSTFLDYFTENDAIYAGKIIHNEYRRGDKKELEIVLMEAVDDSDSVAPTQESTETTSSGEITEGAEVTFMGRPWEVLNVDGDDVEIKSKSSGNTRVVSKDKLS